VNKGLGEEWEDGGRHDNEAKIEVDQYGVVIAVNEMAVLTFDYGTTAQMIGVHVDKLLLMSSESDDLEGIVQIAMGCVVSLVKWAVVTVLCRYRRSGSPFPINVTRNRGEHSTVFTLYAGAFDRVLRCTIVNQGRESQFWSEWPCGPITDISAFAKKSSAAAAAAT
jgi:hypothetical protein